MTVVFKTGNATGNINEHRKPQKKHKKLTVFRSSEAR